MGKKVRLYGLATILFAAMNLTTAFATEIGNGLDLGGQMRWRIEFDGKDFDYGTAMNEMSLLRTRVNLKVTAIEDAIVYFQMQDSRNLGQFNSANLNNDDNLGVHQGYIKLKDLFTEGLDLQLGRFEAAYGRHRLIGNVGWSNVGRSFDGIRLMRKGDTYKADIFCLKVIERGFQFPASHKDRKLYGIYARSLEDKFNIFMLYDWDMMKTGDDYNLARYTFGALFQEETESGLGYVFDVALQVGNQGASDISAYMMAGDFYYSPKPKIMFIYSEVSKIGIGFDITSGDDDPADNDIKWFDNLYYTGHKFRGYMDYFVGTAIPPGLGNLGLMDVVLRGSLVAGDMGTIDIDIHHFRTMEDHIDASDTTATPGTSKALGQEIDLTYNSSLQEGLGFQGGVSAFFASDKWINETDPSFWIYFMLTAGF